MQLAQVELAELVTVRPGLEDDLRYIKSAWSLVAYQNAEYAVHMSKLAKKPAWPVWKTLFPRVQDKILSRASVFVLSPREQPGQILSFAIVEALNDGTPVLHWVMTKRRLLRRGMAEFLLRSLGFDEIRRCVFTSECSIYRNMKGLIPDWDYVPYHLFSP